MRKVIHLLPYDGIGGAEAAARSMTDVATPGIDFQLRYLFPKVRSSSQRGATNNPLAFLTAAWALRSEAPDLIIVSLWRSCIVGILVRLLRPRVRLAILIHNSVDAHLPDFLFTRWAMALSDEVWADSEASVRLRFRKAPRAPVTLIPFVTERLDAVAQPDAGGLPAPSFIFWGRLTAQKNLPKALALFHRISQARPLARLMVIGPDSGELPELKAICSRLGLEKAVRFEGPLPFEDIRARAPGHSFYLQTSDYEGMAMSVVEAMQLGLVPVVTAVGEIGAYCRAGHNAVIVENTDDAAAEVIQLLDDPIAYQTLRHGAIDTWKGKPIYRDAMIEQCRRLTGAPPASESGSPRNEG